MSGTLETDADMGIVAAKGHELELWEARTFDKTWTLYRDRARTLLKDLTGYKVWLTLWGSDIAVPVKVLSDTTGVAPTGSVEGTTGIILGGVLGTIRAYITNESAAIFTYEKFKEIRRGTQPLRYTGGYELVLEDPAAEQYPYLYGDVRFRRTSPHG